MSIGELNPSSVLTEEDVFEIRRLSKLKGVTQKDLSLKYGVSPSTIGAVLRRETWKHVRRKPEPRVENQLTLFSLVSAEEVLLER